VLPDEVVGGPGQCADDDEGDGCSGCACPQQCDGNVAEVTVGLSSEGAGWKTYSSSSPSVTMTRYAFVKVKMQKARGVSRRVVLVVWMSVNSSSSPEGEDGWMFHRWFANGVVLRRRLLVWHVVS